MIKLKNNVKFSISEGQLNDVRLGMMLNVIKNSENTEGWSYDDFCKRIKEEFNVKVTTGRLHMFYIVKQQEEDTGVFQSVLGYYDRKH